MKAYQNLIVTGSINVSGSLLLNGDEVGQGSGNTSVYISGSAPSGSSTGSLWFNENDLNMYVRYYDGTSSFWLPVDSNQTLYANSSSYAVTASYADVFFVSSSLTVTGSSTFFGTASFASQTIVNDLQVINKIQHGTSPKPAANYGVALGNNTMVSGGYGVAIGNSTFVSASANASFVAGNFNTASAFFQTVVGQYNAPNNTAGAFIVGGGSGTESGSRRNTAVFTTSSITLSGSVSISGSLLLNGAEVGGRGATVTISGSIPSGSANSGSLWWNNVDGNLYIQVVGPTGSTYVPATNTVAGGNYGATYTFATTGSTWNINHNLNTRAPLVTVYSGSSVMIPISIDSLDANNTRIIFSGSVAGTAILSTGIGNATTNNAVSASFATTASLTVNATSASLATSASHAVSALSASFATTSSFATSASFATTSSHAVSARSASFATTASTNTLAYASLFISTIPAAQNSDMTPTLANGSGITVSGNTITIERPGVYLMNASIAIRATYAEYAWVDASNNRLTGTNTGLSISANSTDPAGPANAMGIVNITSPNTVIKLRIYVAAGFAAQNAAYAGATITQLR
jgi:hypothetical protein